LNYQWISAKAHGITITYYLLVWQDLIVSWNGQSQPHYFPSLIDEKFLIPILAVFVLENWKNMIQDTQENMIKDARDK